MPIPVPAAVQRLRYGVPNRSNRQLDLLVDRGLLFSGVAGQAEQQAQAAAMYPIHKEMDILRWEMAQAKRRGQRPTPLQGSHGVAP